MARRVFFSFYYGDIMRANIVRNSWLCPPDRDYARSWDQSLWEKAKTQGDPAVKRLIDEGLRGCSVTVVLIGGHTAYRKWVKYEIDESHRQGMGLLGVSLHNIRDTSGTTETRGPNPFGNSSTVCNGVATYLSNIYPVYDWINDDGYNRIGQWIETAARTARR